MNAKKQLLRPLALSMLWLFMGQGCKKEEPPPICEDSLVCCGGSLNYKFTVVGYINGELAALSDPNTFRQEITLEVARANTPKCPVDNAFICSASLEKVADLKPSYIGQKKELTYRVWGTLFDTNTPTLTCQPIHEITIDRIEAVK
jgi:hypothetical protein